MNHALERMLCPSCLQTVVFQPFNAEEGGTAYLCPRPTCKGLVPSRYVLDYFKFPPVVFSLVGMKHHGKSVFLGSLFYFLDHIRGEWPGFSYLPLDETGLRNVREIQRKLEKRETIDPTQVQKGFPQPVIIRLHGIPEYGDCHLLAYDHSGESLQNVPGMKKHAGFVTDSPVVVWLLSLNDLVPPSELDDFLTRYLQAIAELGGNAKRQTLLVVLTKGDQLLDRAPDKVQQFYRSPGGTANLEEMSLVSTELERWMAGVGYQNFVRQAPVHFGRVNYTIVSALGGPKETDEAFKPRKILAPLQWVLIYSPNRRWLLKAGIIGALTLGGALAFKIGQLIAAL